jgi:ABC-type Co2+ transport system permease subunit
MISQNMRLFIHAIFGAAIGLFTSVIFLLLYYGTQYDIPVSDTIRFKSAFWITIIIVGVIFGILFYRDIRDTLNTMFGDDGTHEDVQR